MVAPYLAGGLVAGDCCVQLPTIDAVCACAEGLRYRQIAQVLGISLGTVSISLARSLARLNRVAER